MRLGILVWSKTLWVSIRPKNVWGWWHTLVKHTATGLSILISLTGVSEEAPLIYAGVCLWNLASQCTLPYFQDLNFISNITTHCHVTQRGGCGGLFMFSRSDYLRFQANSTASQHLRSSQTWSCRLLSSLESIPIFFVVIQDLTKNLCSLLLQARSQRALMISPSPNYLSLPWMPVLLKMQLTISLSIKIHMPSALACMWVAWR